MDKKEVETPNWAQRESGENHSRPNAQFEDLGTNTLDGIVVHGYRRTVTLRSKASGTGEPVAVTDEYWYSEELHLNLLANHADPRTGKLTVTVTPRRCPAKRLIATNLPAICSRFHPATSWWT